MAKRHSSGTQHVRPWHALGAPRAARGERGTAAASGWANAPAAQPRVLDGASGAHDRKAGPAAAYGVCARRRLLRGRAPTSNGRARRVAQWRPQRAPPQRVGMVSETIGQAAGNTLHVSAGGTTQSVDEPVPGCTKGQTFLSALQVTRKFELQFTRPGSRRKVPRQQLRLEADGPWLAI
nr:uncharacterized protein LOC126545626 [Dermacentor andersoni]